ncbi:choice-of-anchor U domain-containing protein, partial [Rudaea sp.]|uniref:choice-of-anchor U domain-containing protein n=1 Tax=Rudaea sp. TaxID=2136325 RepID=UPI002ED17692
TLNGMVSANGTATTVSFDYGLTTSYGSNAAAAQSPLAANASNAPVSFAVASLACGQTYHFRVVADNGNGGPVHGGDQMFTTSACAAQAPTATSLAATAIGTTSATITGTVNANGAATTVSFAYGASAAYGSTIAATPTSLPANAVGTAVSATLNGLTCATTYHFRVDATNANGAGHGGDLTLTTAACPVVTTFTGPTATGTGNAHAVLSGGGPTCTLVNPAFVAAPVSPPAGVSFPDGLFQFQASGCTGTITLTVTFPSPFTANEQYWKYGPTLGQASDHWYTLGAANNLSLLANVATFTIADGGLGDDDLSVNGTIIDAGGPSIAAAVNPQATAVPAPALDPRNLMTLIALLAAFGTIAARNRGKFIR